MSFHVSDRILFVVVLLGLSVTYVTVPLILQHVKDAAKSPAPDSAPKGTKLEKDAEDALKLDTLRNLSDGHSLALRSSAIKIVAARVVRTRTRELLLQDLASKDDERRDNAIKALWLLISSRALNDKNLTNCFVDHATFSALITALVNVLPLHKRPDQDVAQPSADTNLPPSPVRPSHRPVHEISLMAILRYLLHHQVRSDSPFVSSTRSNNLPIALAAGLVTRWLAIYPFPCTLPEYSKFNYKKSDVASLFEWKTWASDDADMYYIMKLVTHSPRGLKQLRMAGLRASSYIENVDRGGGRRSSSSWSGRNWEDDDDHDVRMLGGEATAGIPIENWQPFEPVGGFSGAGGGGPRLRSMERSREEEALRRQHRETIVLAEHGTPLGRENILQRVNSYSAPTPIGPPDRSSISTPISYYAGSMPDLEDIHPSHPPPNAPNPPPAVLDPEEQLAELRREVDREMAIEEFQDMIRSTNLSPEQLQEVMGDLDAVIDRTDQR